MYDYVKDHSGYFSKEQKKNEEYEDFKDELTLLTVIPSSLIGSVSKVKEFR